MTDHVAAWMWNFAMSQKVSRSEDRIIAGLRRICASLVPTCSIPIAGS